MSKTNSKERRKNIRYRARKGAFAVMLPDCTTMGSILDISESGLSFTYQNGQSVITTEDQNRSKPPTELSIVLSGDEFYLDKIHVKIISDIKFSDSDDSKYIQARRCSIKFEKLTFNQEARLEYFIQNHTSGVTLR